MKTLDVEIGDEISTRRQAIRNFQGRVVIVNYEMRGKIRGRIISTQNSTYTLSTPVNPLAYFIFGREIVLPYDGLNRLRVVNPKQDDELRAREGYVEITDRTIAETVKWAQRIRT